MARKVGGELKRAESDAANTTAAALPEAGSKAGDERPQPSKAPKSDAAKTDIPSKVASKAGDGNSKADGGGPHDPTGKPGSAVPSSNAVSPTDSASKSLPPSTKPTPELGPGLAEGAEVWALVGVAPTRWRPGKATGSCGHARYEISMDGPKTLCLSGALIATAIPKGTTLAPGQRVLIQLEGEEVAAGTVHRVSNDGLVRRDKDGAELAVPFDRLWALGVGSPLARPETKPGQNVWAQHLDGHFRLAIRKDPCVGGYMSLVAPQTRHCLASAQLAPDRELRSVEPGARVLTIPELGEKDAWAGTVMSLSGGMIRVLQDGGDARDVPLNKLRLLSGPGELGAQVVHDAKRCAKLNVKNKAFNARGQVGFRFTNRCLRPIRCQMNIAYYCAHDEADSKSDWFVCDRSAAAGETLSCSNKRCRQPRRGDEATYRAIRCRFDEEP